MSAPASAAKAGTQSDLKNQLATRPQTGVEEAKEKQQHPMMVLLTRHESQIKMALPRTGLEIDRFKRIAVTTYNMNPNLRDCEPMSFLASCMLAAQMGLEPGGPMGQAWLVPYKGKVAFQVGYKGLLTMMWRSKQYSQLIVNMVCKNDLFEYEYGSNQHLKHIEAEGDRGPVIRYYTYAKYVQGGEYFKVFSRADIENYRKFSKMPNSPAWRDHYDAMAMKTCLIHAATWMPMSIEVERNIAQDGAIKNELAEDMTEAAGEYPDGGGFSFTDKGPVDDEETAEQEGAAANA